MNPKRHILMCVNICQYEYIHFKEEQNKLKRQRVLFGI